MSFDDLVWKVGSLSVGVSAMGSAYIAVNESVWLVPVALLSALFGLTFIIGSVQSVVGDLRWVKASRSEGPDPLEVGHQRSMSGSGRWNSR